MAEEKNVRDDPIVLRYRGAFAPDQLLDIIRKFYKSVLIDCKEDKLKWKGDEIEFKCHGDRKVTDMVKISLYTEMNVWMLGEIEIVESGQKVKRPYGKVELRVNGAFQNDYADIMGKAGKLGEKISKALHDPAAGIDVGDLKQAGEKFIEKTLISYVETLKKFFGMECTT